MRQTKSIIALKSRQATVQVEDYIFRNIINPIDKGFIINPLNIIIDFQTITLFPQKTFSTEIKKNQFLLILPLIGGIEILNANENSNFIENESLDFISKSGSIHLFNPFESDSVQFILIKIESENNSLQNHENFKFELENSNKLMPIFHDNLLNIKLSIGQFDARAESEYKLLQKDNCIVAYNISGVFEVDNKLLELNDALVMSDLPDFEFESLNNQSILLVLEC